MRLASSEDHLAEILVVGDEDPLFDSGFPQDVLVLSPAGDGPDGDSVVSLLSEPSGDGRPGTLVDEKAHRSVGFDR